MVRRISKKEARILSSRCRKEEKEQSACEEMEVEDLVDLAVKALGEYGVSEIEYEKGEEPAENEAICEDEEGNQVGVEVDVKAKKLNIDLDEDMDIVIDLDQPADAVKEDLKADLEEMMADQEEAEESRRRFEDWKRNRSLRKEGKRIAIKSRK